MRSHIRRLILCSLLVAVAAGVVGFVPGSNTTFVNASPNVIGIQCETTAKLYAQKIGLNRGGRLGLSGDYGDLISLTVSYSGGHSMTLRRRDLAARKAAARIRKGVWWITESEVRYISGRDANIWQRRLTGGKI